MNRIQNTSLLVSLAVHGVVGAFAFTCLTSRPAQAPVAEVPIVIEMIAAEPDVAPKPLPAAAVDSLPAPSSPLARKQELTSLLSAPTAALSAVGGFETRSAVAPAQAEVNDSGVESLPSVSSLSLSLPAFAPVDIGSLPTNPAVGSPRESDVSTSDSGHSIAYRQNPAPIYPSLARREKQQGLVLLRVEVSEEGVALRVEVEQSSGHRLLDAAALKAVHAWRFEPARAAGRPVKAHAQVPIHFKLEG